MSIVNRVCQLNHSKVSWRPIIACQHHLWRHLKGPSSNGGGQLMPKLAIVNAEWDVILRQDHVIWTIQNRHGAHELHLGRHLKEASSIGGRQLTGELAIVILIVILWQRNLEVCHLNYSEPSRHPRTACQLHLWRHLKDSLVIGDRQLARQLAIVNWEWDFISRQDNVNVCHLIHSEQSWRPGTAH